MGHVYSADHNAVNCSALAVLNVHRDSMIRFGYSPATRLFEAAGAGACLITDAWEGIEDFFEPEAEVLVVQNGAEVAEKLKQLTPERAQKMGQLALARALAEHTYDKRALEVERAIEGQRLQRPADKPITQLASARAPSAARTQHIAIVGLSITSSWGNGHATTYRGLVRALAQQGHRVTFFERDVPWYSNTAISHIPRGQRSSLHKPRRARGPVGG
jgi:spore maturation protein CgeB